MENTSVNQKLSYHDLVYAVARKIPVGRVSTYGAIANYLALGSSRMAGWAMSSCRPGDGVPAHRVVNRKGELSGRNHFPTPTMMQSLLEAEGIVVEDDKVRDFKRLFWDPLENLGNNFEFE